MRALLRQVVHSLERGQDAELVTVLASAGSTPRGVEPAEASTVTSSASCPLSRLCTTCRSNARIRSAPFLFGYCTTRFEFFTYF